MSCDVGYLYQRVELLLGGEWRPGTVARQGSTADRVLVELEREFRGENSYWVSKCHLRPRAT